jgi:hypothetical protein
MHDFKRAYYIKSLLYLKDFSYDWCSNAPKTCQTLKTLTDAYLMLEKTKSGFVCFDCDVGGRHVFGRYPERGLHIDGCRVYLCLEKGM